MAVVVISFLMTSGAGLEAAISLVGVTVETAGEAATLMMPD